MAAPNWKSLDTEAQLDELIEESHQHPVAIFKHSTTCGISAGALNGLEHDWNLPDEAVQMYFLDLLRNRSVSNAVADRLGIRHQSPQIILLKNGQAVYDTSHFSISAKKLEKALSKS